MNVEYSKSFAKSVKKLSGKMLKSVSAAIKEVKNAEALEDITDCIKMQSYDYVYRMKIGSLRAFFIFHINIENDCVFFEYLVNRGEAYKKSMQEKLKEKDK